MNAPLDPYLELGVPRAASTSEITDAYHRLARQCHPDTGSKGGNEKAAEGALPGPLTWIGGPDSLRVTPALRVTALRWLEGLEEP